MRKAILIVGLIGAGAVALCLWALWTGRAEPPATHASDTLTGVDVSRHQGVIDWTALAGDRVSFAYIKATEGGDWTDPKFAANWIGARRAGLPRGAYHFFTLCRDPQEQAAHFLATVGDMTGALVPALDAEHMGPCREGPTMVDVGEGVAQFLDTVQSQTGVRPVIYTTKEFYTAHLTAPGLQAERFWLRSLYLEPNFGPADWTIWQYSGRGRRRGVAGPVDLNVLAGGEAALAALTVE